MSDKKETPYSIMAEYLAKRYGGIALEIKEALIRGSTRMLDKHFIPTSKHEWIFSELYEMCEEMGTEVYKAKVTFEDSFFDVRYGHMKKYRIAEQDGSTIIDVQVVSNSPADKTYSEIIEAGGETYFTKGR